MGHSFLTALAIIGLGSLAAASTNAPTCAVISIATKPDYLLGAMALAQSLDATGSQLPRVLLVTDNFIPPNSSEEEKLRIAGWDVIRRVDVIPNPAPRHQKRKDEVFTKLRIFDYFEYDTLVYLDADVIARENIDSLCNVLPKDKDIAARPHTKWLGVSSSTSERQADVAGVVGAWKIKSYKMRGQKTDVFNSGVMVFHPQRKLFDDLLLELLFEVSAPDSCLGGPGCNDQRILNIYFRNRVHYLSMVWNAPATHLKDQRPEMKVLTDLGMAVMIDHYYGGSKPWWSLKQKWQEVSEKGPVEAWGDCSFTRSLAVVQDRLRDNGMSLFESEIVNELPGDHGEAFTKYDQFFHTLRYNRANQMDVTEDAAAYSYPDPGFDFNGVFLGQSVPVTVGPKGNTSTQSLGVSISVNNLSANLALFNETAGIHCYGNIDLAHMLPGVIPITYSAHIHWISVDNCEGILGDHADLQIDSNTKTAIFVLEPTGIQCKLRVLDILNE